MTNRRAPAEFYGRIATEKPPRGWSRFLSRQYCPFLGRTCKKPRKSQPEQTTGACILQYGQRYVIVCPERFLQGDQVFLSVLPLLKRAERYAAVPEVRVPAGSLDWLVVSLTGEEVVDYAGLELQTLDTTGTGAVWDARVDLAAGRMRDSYGFGLNWRMSAKTILVQMLHKAPTFDALHKKVVLALQNPFFEYLRREFTTQHLVPAVASHTVHFHVYDCLNINNVLRLSLVDRLSCSLQGLELMLRQADRPQVSEADIVAAIKARLPKARMLSM
jgi:hypothetical protein